MRVQNAKSVINSQPPIRIKETKPHKEMSFIEMMNSVRTAIQNRGNALTFTNLSTNLNSRRRQPNEKQCQYTNCQRLNVGGCGAGGGSSAPGNTHRSGSAAGGDGTHRNFERCSERCTAGGGPGGDCVITPAPTCTCACTSHICCNACGLEAREKIRRLHGGYDETEHVMRRRFDCAMPRRPTCPMATRRSTAHDGPHSEWECDHNESPAIFNDAQHCTKGCLGTEPPFRPLETQTPRCCRNGCLRMCQSDWQTERTLHVPTASHHEPPVTSAPSPTTKRSKHKERGETKKNAIPQHVLRRYQDLVVSKDTTLIRRLLRPRIFFDFEVKGVRPLGRLTIQLFTEACPEVVLEFVRTCTMQNRERLSFTRLFPPLWMEGELALTDNKTLTARNIEHDTNVLDHGVGAGILSFPSRYVRGSKRRFLSFSISFKPLNVLNGKRIAFGRVRRGHWILDAIQDYGTNSGKPQREIVVTHCGMLQ